jgi:large subunit ribosomal protein L23Ae
VLQKNIIRKEIQFIFVDEKLKLMEENQNIQGKLLPVIDQLMILILFEFLLHLNRQCKKVENLNTLVFIVDRNANKLTIKHVFETLYKVKVGKINTLIMFSFYYCFLINSL